MKISVCIPTYNQAQYLKFAVFSAANQTLKPFEIIVSNDCSTDNTAEVLEELSKEVPELVVIHQLKNLGISANTDACLRRATGTYIVRLDSDDSLLETYCEKLSNSLSKYPEAGFAHAAVYEIDQFNNILKMRWLARPTSFQSSQNALKLASKGYKVAANIVMFKKDALENVNYLSGRPDYVEDFHLNASLSAAGYGNLYCNEILAYYRVWLDPKKMRQRRKLMEIKGVKKVYEEILEPEFTARHWSLKILKKNKETFACNNTDCLSWDIYSQQEKNELKDEIWSISSSRKVRLYTWMNLNGLNRTSKFISDVPYKVKIIIKTILFRPQIIYNSNTNR